jgi:penicillin-binding protein 2
MFPRSRRSELDPVPERLPLALRATALGLVAVLALGVLVFRLWALQVLQTQQNVAQAQAEPIRYTRIPAERGEIFDADMRPLVTNRQEYELEITPADYPDLASPTECTGLTRKDFAELKAKPGCALLARVAFVLDEPLAKVWTAFRQGWPTSLGATPIPVAQNLTYNQLAYMSERQRSFVGVQVTQTWRRAYPMQAVLGPIAPNILGYVGPVSETDLKNPWFRAEHLPRDGTVGKMGVEQSYDGELRGVDGQVAQTFNAFNEPVGQARLVRAPQPGDDLRLTINAHLQAVAQQAVEYGIHVAQADSTDGFLSNQGAIVAMNPDTGAILAMASLPLWKNSVANNTASKAFAWLVSPKNKMAPMVDRAFGAAFPAGSTFKPMTATAAWENGIIGPGSSLDCPGVYYSKYARDHIAFHNWNPDSSGVIGLSTALEISCDTFFYQLGDDFFGHPMSTHGAGFQQWLEKLGYGHAPQLDMFGVSPGLVPTPAWKAQNFKWGGNPCKISPYCKTPQEAAQLQIWEPGDDINMAIGQGYLLVSPLQMAVAYSALENGGTVVTPHVVGAILNPANHAVIRTIAPKPKAELHLPSSLLNEIDDGLYLATHSPSGTSSAVFGHFSPTVYGKTGTAQVPGDCTAATGPNCPVDDAWWVGWAQQGNRKLVVAAFIRDGGEGGVAAAPAALRVFEAYFHEKLTSVVGVDVSH